MNVDAVSKNILALAKQYNITVKKGDRLSDVLKQCRAYEKKNGVPSQSIDSKSAPVPPSTSAPKKDVPSIADRWAVEDKYRLMKLLQDLILGEEEQQQEDEEEDNEEYFEDDNPDEYDYEI